MTATNQAPGGLLGSLPREPWPTTALFDLDRAMILSLVLSGLVLVALGLWLWRARRRETAVSPTRTSTPLALPMPPRDSFAEEVRRLEQRTLASHEYRRGCHTLARCVRHRLERELHLGNASSLALTAEEIAQRAADPRIDELARELRRARFDRRPPKRRTFQRLCARALTVLAEAGEEAPREARSA